MDDRMIRTEAKRETLLEKPLPPKTIVTPEILKQAVEEVFPPIKPVGEIVVKIPKGRPATGQAKVPITLRLDQDVVAALQARGVDWRLFANEVLRKALNLSDP
jgi:uncharacterized protein (DUF4415 family)